MSVLRLQEIHLNFLRENGIEHRLTKGSTLPRKFSFESPFKLQGATLFHSAQIGAFTYLVEGSFYHTKIGRYCSIARDVSIGPGEHPGDWLSTSPVQYDKNFRFQLGKYHEDKESLESFTLRPDTPNPHKATYTTIGNDVLIGTKVFIKRGVTVGDGAIIGAHAVITKDVPPYAVVVGNPGRIVRYRFDEETIAKLLEVQWWQYPIWGLSNLRFDDIQTSLKQLEQRVEAGTLTPYKPTLITERSLAELSEEAYLQSAQKSKTKAPQNT